MFLFTFREIIFANKNVEGKLFSWRVIIKYIKGLGVSQISIFVVYLIMMKKDLLIKKLVKNLRN